jgi:hypothetical protein
MSTVGTITKHATDLATHVVGKAAHAVTHPVRTAEDVVSRARDVASTVIGGGRAPAPPATAPFPEAPPVRTARPQEPSVTEPKAPSRNAQHGGPGDDRVDDWREELAGGPDVTTPVGTTGAGPGYNPDTGETDLQQPDTEPLMDPSLTKKVKAEAETMRQASEPDAQG